MVELIADVIRQGRRFFVTMHRRPDGDAAGSSLALACALREMGKTVFHYNADPLPFNFRFLPGADQIERKEFQGPFDAAFVCDTPRLDEIADGLPVVSAGRGVLISIDHHAGAESYGDLNLLDPSAAAAGVLVYKLLQHLEHPISVDVAHNLFAAIMSDTGSFRYDSTDAESLRICADLLACGVSPWQLSSRIYETQPFNRVKLLSSVLATLELAEQGRLAILTATREMLRICGSGDDMLDGFVNYARSVEGVEVALILVEQDENEYEATFRSRGEIDLGSLAVVLGGRGGGNGACARLTGTLMEVKQRASGAVGDLFSADTAVA